ncbi:MAG: hypothetical protein A3F11_03685 [Gammaproteobacteria bacterium RIFCSPHIGHO2_12_FULL_37_14]|nr:MAG: hypothetical protein A3F11_03685 [Gammaproteobacteria bacterium RIFCSPHIGHO2_12_FULL_37_14]
MPIVKKNGVVIEISGDEYAQIISLHEKIKNNESITESISKIDPENLETLLTWSRSYMTEDCCNVDNLMLVHLAAKMGNLEALKVLSSTGVKLDLYTENYGKTPLHFAARYNHLEVIDYLVKEKHMSVDIPDKLTKYYDSGRLTPLFECATTGSVAVAEKLISLGANVNYQGLEGDTPLHFACRYGVGGKHSENVFKLIDVLLKNGANPELRCWYHAMVKDKKTYSPTYRKVTHYYTPIDTIYSVQDRTEVQKLINTYYPNPSLAQQVHPNPLVLNPLVLEQALDKLLDSFSGVKSASSISIFHRNQEQATEAVLLNSVQSQAEDNKKRKRDI